MRKIFLQLFAIGLAITSCDSYTDIHQKYLEGGEIVYLQKIDSVVTHAGSERLQLKLWYNNGNRLTKTVVYYNNYNDSIVIDLKDKLKSGKDSLDMIVELPETNYNFNIVNFNVFNQHSLPVAHFASTYGDMYKATLKNRQLKASALLPEDGGFKVDWFAPAESYIGMEVEYNTESGPKVVTVSKESSLTIAEIPADMKFRYRTFFLPEDNAIDAIPCNWTGYIDLK
ncbi:MAG: DUF4998 domain-containing protein [Bacteroidales bacterium]